MYFRLVLLALTLLIAWPAQATLVDNGDSTVTDTATGLMWDQCGLGQTGSGCTGTLTTLNWQAALSQAVALNANGGFKGHNDWRLPNKNELETLADLARTRPAIDGSAFPNTPTTSAYWSSTHNAGALGNAWTVEFGDGMVASASTGSSLYVRLVRGGQNTDRLNLPSPATTFVPDRDGGGVLTGTVTDTATGLMWDQCGLGQTGSGCTGALTTLTWQAALRQAAALNANGGFKGHNDWRLPNKNELETLADLARTRPAIDSSAFPNTPSTSTYWSSTHNAGALGQSWTVEFGDGSVASASTGTPLYVRLVRGGRYGAAADLLNLTDTTPPVFTAGPTIAWGPTQSGVTFDVTSNEAATGYWLVVPRSATTPTAAQVKAGTNYSAVTLAGHGSGAMPASVATTFSVTGLTAGTSYDIYVAGEDTGGNLQVSPASLSFTTLASPPTDPTPPVFTAGPSITSGPTQSSVTFSVTLNEQSQLYLIVVPAAATPPTAVQVRAGVNAAGAFVTHYDYRVLANTATSQTVYFASPGTAYMLYMAASDTAGNLQASPTSLAVTTAPATGATCGTANGQAYAALPTTTAELCSQGTPTTLSQSGPWTWSCNATSGGATAACATVAVSACSSSPVLKVARVDLKDAANSLYVTNQAAIKQTYNVFCASGRFGVVRMPVLANSYALVQTSCFTSTSPRIEGYPTSSGQVLDAITAAGDGTTDKTVDLLRDLVVGPLATAVCQ